MDQPLHSTSHCSMLTLVQTTLQEQGEYGNEDKYRNEITLLWCCVCRYSSETRDAVFSVGLQGIREEDVETVKELIWTTLNKVAELVLLLFFLFILFLYVYPVRNMCSRVMCLVVLVCVCVNVDKKQPVAESSQKTTCCRLVPYCSKISC